jgi:peptide deformylase
VDLVGEETEEAPEGCLSIPGYRFDCRRHLHVVATGWNVHGDPVRVEGSHLLARAVQHEVDHLDGVVFVDRLDPEARAAALTVLAEAEWRGLQAWVPRVEVSPH